MKQRSFGLLLLVLLVCIFGVGLYIHNTASQTITVIWQGHSQAFTQQDQQDIQNDWKNALLSSNSSHIAGHEFAITNAQRQGTWAIFSANEKESPSTQPLPEPLFFLAHLQGTTWVVWIPSSLGFCEELKQVPDTLLNATDKQLFC